MSLLPHPFRRISRGKLSSGLLNCRYSLTRSLEAPYTRCKLLGHPPQVLRCNVLLGISKCLSLSRQVDRRLNPSSMSPQSSEPLSGTKFKCVRKNANSWILTLSLKRRLSVRWTAILLESSPTWGLNFKIVLMTSTGVISRGGRAGALGCYVWAAC